MYLKVGDYVNVYGCDIGDGSDWTGYSGTVVSVDDAPYVEVNIDPLGSVKFHYKQCRRRKTSCHLWGSSWPYFNDVSEAADYIGDFLRRWGRVDVTQTKEKFGQVRVYCSFGWYSMFSITHPGYVYSRYPKWLWKFDIEYLSRIVGKMNSFIIPLHQRLYRYAYKRAIKKYPHIRREILAAADYSELLKGL